MVVFSPTKFEDLGYLILRFKQHKKKIDHFFWTSVSHGELIDRRLSARLGVGTGTCGAAEVLSFERPSGSDKCERLAAVETTLNKRPCSSLKVPIGPRGRTVGGFASFNRFQ